MLVLYPLSWKWASVSELSRGSATLLFFTYLKQPRLFYDGYSLLPVLYKGSNKPDSCCVCFVRVCVCRGVSVRDGVCVGGLVCEMVCVCGGGARW